MTGIGPARDGVKLSDYEQSISGTAVSYSTVTLLAKFRGKSMGQPLSLAV